MGSDVLGLDEIDRTQVALAGGKGANLGELSQIEGIGVPAGFCVTTEAFRRVLAEVPAIEERVERLSFLDPADRAAVGTQSAEIRRAIEAVALPDALGASITEALVRLGADAAYAVRSSATAEDLPTASFAGQHDSYLNVIGPAGVLEHVVECWASLFTERAVTYRLRNAVDHRHVHIAVVVQRMVDAHASGVLFTAEPVTSNRTVASVEACSGLGGALVSGQVDADAYQVRDDRIIARTVASGQSGPALTDAQVVELVQLGRRIESHFGHPQDIEWCRSDGRFWIVQSRPITTLTPRVLTSDGQAVAGSSRRDGLPAGALAGLAVSAGTVEGRARVIHDISEADIDEGDILVTKFTDPGWTPLFVAIAGLVTEVGGLMTHGAVIAREYGLPAVVGVEQATVRIRDGQRIRVHGTDGYVELLE